jgi:tetratricopeptide (TPR) repeat protein
VNCANILRVVSIALAALCASPARAADGVQSFEQAVTAYQAGDYANARALWLDALRGSPAPDRASVFFNLGNVAYREKKPLEAAGWYTASLRLEPRSADAWHNLEFVRREAGLDPADRGDLVATTRRLLGSLTLAESERAVLGMLGVLALALVFEALRGSTLAKSLSIASAALVALALVPWAYQSSRRGRDELFTTQPEGAPLLSEPRNEAPVIGRLSAASEVERIDRLPGWVRVRTDDGAVGWVKSESCLALAGPEPAAAAK